MSGAMLHGLGDCTPELNCGCITVPSEIADHITEDARQLEGFIRSQLEIAFDRPAIAIDLFGDETPEPTVQED